MYLLLLVKCLHYHSQSINPSLTLISLSDILFASDYLMCTGDYEPRMSCLVSLMLPCLTMSCFVSTNQCMSSISFFYPFHTLLTFPPFSHIAVPPFSFVHSICCVTARQLKNISYVTQYITHQILVN